MLPFLSPRRYACLFFSLFFFSAFGSVSAPFMEGRWVKIRVGESGIYQLTYDELREIGFVSPEKVGVFGYGGPSSLADDALGCIDFGLPRAAYRHFGEKLVFYAEGPLSVSFGSEPPYEVVDVVQNPYSSYGYYFLGEGYGGAPEMPWVELSDTSGQCIGTHRHIEVINRDLTSFDDMGSRWFDVPFGCEARRSYSFDEVISDDVEVEASVHIGWLTEVPGELFADLIGGEVTASYNMSVTSAKSPVLKHSRLGCSLLSGRNPVVDLGFSGSLGKNFVAVDYVALDYTSCNRMPDSGQIMMYMPRIGNGDYVYMPGEVEIWDVTDVADVHRLETADGRSTPAVSETERRLVAFDPVLDMMAPEVVGAVGRQDLRGDREPVDMLIVAHSDFLDYAVELASIHRDLQGLKVKVVTDEWIYNEFSSGQPSAVAIRAYVKWLYEVSGGEMKHLLLYGDGSYDNRGIVERGSYLPTYQCRSDRYMFDSERSYCSDAYFGIAESKVPFDRMPFAESSVAVGRLPVGSAVEAHDVNEKIRSHIVGASRFAEYSRKGVFICDSGDGGIHLANAEKLASMFESGDGAVTHKIYSAMSRWTDGKAPSAVRDYSDRLRSGCGFVNYTGHGTEYDISNQHLWSVADVGSVDYDIKPVVFHSSCLNGRFDGDRRSLAEGMLTARNGGASACIMASRNTDATYNQRLHGAFMAHVARGSGTVLLGDIWLKAQNECVEAARAAGNSAYAINVRHFNLLGDPALPLYFPEYGVELTVDDSSHSGCGADVAGRVIDTDGGMVADFEGVATLTAYRTDVTGEAPEPAGVDVSFNDVPLWSGNVAVRSGEFAVTTDFPFATAGIPFRFVCVAVNDESCAVGELDSLQVGSSEGFPDTEPPVIERVEICGDTYSGMFVSPNKFVAYISDTGSGLCRMASVAGYGCRVGLDGVDRPVDESVFRSVGEGKWVMECILPPLTDGRHELRLIVGDNAGNRAEKSMTFTVINLVSSIELWSDSRTVRDEASFGWTHDLPDDARLRLLVRDMNGRTVCSELLDGGVSSYKWNLRGLDGMYVADGPYDCTLLATDGTRYAVSPTVEIVVLR